MNPTATLAPAPLDWSPALFLGDARMDDTHEEFVTLLNQLLATRRISNCRCTARS